MNTLYISDLDGTLLQPNVEISARAKRILNERIEEGLNFTVATARSIASVRYILKDIKIKHPVIMMNGVCIYDFEQEKYLNVETIPPTTSKMLLALINEHQIKGFAYTMKEGVMSTYYEELGNSAMKQFHDERVKLYRKPFYKIESFLELIDEPLIYFTIMDKRENLEALLPYVNEAKDVNSVFYKDNYHKDVWYLEIFSKNASKYHGVSFLRNHLQAKEIVCFGDNLNDLALFEASDYRIAVGNAVDALKEQADLVIPSNTQDGVPLWLQFNGKLG